MCIDYGMALNKGLNAMIEECNEEFKNNRYFGTRSFERGITLLAMRESLTGLVHYAERFSKLAAEMAEKRDASPAQKGAFGDF